MSQLVRRSREYPALLITVTPLIKALNAIVGKRSAALLVGHTINCVPTRRGHKTRMTHFVTQPLRSRRLLRSCPSPLTRTVRSTAAAGYADFLLILFLNLDARAVHSLRKTTAQPMSEGRSLLARKCFAHQTNTGKGMARPVPEATVVSIKMPADALSSP